MTLDEARLYLKEDSTDADVLAFIQSLITAATSYINQQTGKTQVKTGTDEAGLPIYAAISTDELYNICLKMLLAHWYENRGPQITGTVMAKVDHSVDALVNHISLCGDYT